jgi:hypothetical protein
MNAENSQPDGLITRMIVLATIPKIKRVLTSVGVTDDVSFCIDVVPRGTMPTFPQHLIGCGGYPDALSGKGVIFPFLLGNGLPLQPATGGG